jgi:hypothetical protein
MQPENEIMQTYMNLLSAYKHPIPVFCDEIEFQLGLQLVFL